MLLKICDNYSPPVAAPLPPRPPPPASPPRSRPPHRLGSPDACRLWPPVGSGSLSSRGLLSSVGDRVSQPSIAIQEAEEGVASRANRGLQVSRICDSAVGTATHHALALADGKANVQIQLQALWLRINFETLLE